MGEAEVNFHTETVIVKVEDNPRPIPLSFSYYKVGDVVAEIKTTEAENKL